MTDKELLEYAAKAAGVDSDRLKNRYDHWDKDHAPVLVGRAWNPLTDDGDALRLAIKCGISVLQFRACIRTGWPQNGLPARLIGFDPPYEDTSSGQDVFAATRRAIVRAAAEMGNIV